MNPILEGFFKNILIESCLKSKRYSSKKKLKYIKLINEANLAVIPMMALANSVGSLVFPKIQNFNISLRKKLSAMMDDNSENNIENTEELKALKERYNDVMTRYNEIKQTGTKQEKQELEQEVKQLTSDIRNFLNRKESYNTENEPIQSDDEFENEENYDEKFVEKSEKTDYSSDEFEQPSGNNVNTNIDITPINNPDLSKSFVSKGKNYGDLTFEIDSQSSQIWSNIAFTKCNQFSGKPLWSCRGQAVDKSISFIKSKINNCSSTNYPEECRKSLINLINNWNERKKFYYKKIR